MVYAPNGALMGEILNGDSFGWTIHDGTYAEVAITDETLEIAGRAVQDTYDVLPWRKPGTFEFPSR